VISSLEAMTGLLMFAIITGLMYGRFSKPTAHILFSENMLMAPYQEGKALMFRIVNKRKSMIMDLTIRVILSFHEKGKSKAYLPLDLERSFVTLFPLNWTIVHPITPASPLYGREEFFADADTEIIVVVKGFDDTFSQDVHAISSYRYQDIVWNAKFEPMYDTLEDDTVVLDLSKLNKYQRL
jgi:inward rectifier potassium channel